jgi:hypothetical protein
MNVAVGMFAFIEQLGDPPAVRQIGNFLRRANIVQKTAAFFHRF